MDGVRGIVLPDGEALEEADFSKPWIIWDNIVLAHLLGMTSFEVESRPELGDDMKPRKVATNRKITWITGVDSKRLWDRFLRLLDDYQATHFLEPAAVPGRLTFLMP